MQKQKYSIPRDSTWPIAQDVGLVIAISFPGSFLFLSRRRENKYAERRSEESEEILEVID